MPDHFDPDFETKVSAREDAIRANATYEFNLKQQQAAQQQQQYNQQQAAQQQANKRAEAFQANAKALKIDEKELIDSENVVGSYINNPDVAVFLLEDKNGPLLVDYLAKNVKEFDSFQNLSSMGQVAHIVGSILPKAVKGAKQKSKAPDPLNLVKGSRGSESDPEWMSGGTIT